MGQIATNQITTFLSKMEAEAEAMEAVLKSIASTLLIQPPLVPLHPNPATSDSFLIILLLRRTHYLNRDREKRENAREQKGTRGNKRKQEGTRGNKNTIEIQAMRGGWRKF